MRFEKIIFCVDIGQEAGCEFVGPPTITRLECAKLLMKRYIFQKSRFNPKHEFGLCTVTDLTLWSQECTSDVERLNNSIDLLEYENRQIPMWDMSTLFSAIHDLQPDAKSMHTLRVILIYCRSNVIPMSPDPEQLAAFQRNPHCFLDGIYVHDKASSLNRVQDIYDSLSHLEREDGSDRFYELTKEFRRFAIAMTKLLAHPAQRMFETPNSFLLEALPGPVDNLI